MGNIIPIKQILLENITDINKLDKKYGNQFSNNTLNSIHQQKFGTPLTPDEIEEYRKTSNIVFNLDKTNPTGFIRVKQFSPNDQTNIRFFHALNDNLKIQPKEINYISNLASTQKGTGKLLLNNIDHNGNPILLKAWNKDLIPYYKQHGYTQLIHPELRGKLNMYKLNESTILMESEYGPSQEWKDANSKKVVTPIQIKHNITVYGEHHFKPDEVHSIRAQIVQNKPDIIVHEIPEDYEFYKKHLPGTRFYQLERGLDKNIFEYFPNDLSKQFERREKNMLRNIDFAGSFTDNKPRTINVVVGDTHLRTIDTPELGQKSPFHNRGFNIVRSKYSEIK